MIRVTRNRLALFVGIIICFAIPSAGQRRERLVDSWRPLHYEVRLSFNDKLTEFSYAQTAITLEVLRINLTEIDFDFGELPIDSVTVAGKPAQYDRAPNLLKVLLPRAAQHGDKLNVAVTYHGSPKDGLIFANDRDGKPSVTGDNWPNRVHHWIPSLDHPSAKATVSFTIAAPPRDLVVANGTPLSMTRNGAAPSVWRFEEAKAIPPYCMVIAINEGAQIMAEDSTVTPLSYYVPQRDRGYAPKGFSAAAPALAFFNETVGPYPYEKLALIVGATRFGGMENSSAIVFTSTLFDLRPNEKMSARFGIPSRIESLMAHEIAHQWFGDSVTASTWADLWLSEGFATYFAALFIEKYEGEQAFHAYMRGAAERYFAYEKQRNAPIHDTQTEDLMKLLNENNYEKGAWVLHMLRKRLGDEAFFSGLRSYYRVHREGTATTEDLRKELEKASGKDLKEFFARWIYDSGHPRYQVLWTTGKRPGSVNVTVNQIQDGAPFLDPLPIEIAVDGGPIKKTIYPTSKTTTLTISLKGKPTSISLDPDATILKEVAAKLLTAHSYFLHGPNR
jgi:aminopeptidase N